MDMAVRWPQGLTYEQFLAGFTTVRYAERTREAEAEFRLTPAEVTFWRRFTALWLRVLVIGAEWCPDVIQHLPVLMHIAREARMAVRIFDRDTNPDLMTPDTFLAPGGKMRIPVFVFLDQDWREVGRWTERSRLANDMVETRRAALPPADHPEYQARNQELYQEMGEEYRRGYLQQAAARELQELLAPLVTGAGAAPSGVDALTLFPQRNDFRERVLPAVAALTPEQLDWTPPGSRNAISYYLRHIAQVEDWFIHFIIRQQPGFTPRRKAELPDLASILDYLHQSRAQTEAFLQPYTVDQLLAERRPLPPEWFKGNLPESETLLWIVHRIFWHEVYHSAQILLVMRMQGLQPPPV